MARTRQTSRSKLITPTTLTWTRFHQPPDREWPPAWPFAGTGHAEDLHLGPLAGVPGIESAFIGRMVDHPEEAVYIIEWAKKKNKEEQYVDIEKFWASHACQEFLDNLPESKLVIKDQSSPSHQSSAKATTEQHCKHRFLVLEYHDGNHGVDMGGRVALAAFLAPVRDKADVSADGSSDSWPYEGIKEVFGENQLLPEYVDVGMWWHHTTWWQGPAVSAPVDTTDSKKEGQELAALQRLERYLLGNFDCVVDGGNSAEGSKVGDHTEGNGGPEVVICEIRRWQTARSARRSLEEKISKDIEARQEWDEAAKETKGQGLIKVWKKERWDIRPVPNRYNNPIDELEYQLSDSEELEDMLE